MNRRNIYAIAAIILLASLMTAVIAISRSAQNEKVILRVKTSKDVIFLGEPLKLEFEVSNEGETVVQIPDGGVMSGHVEVLIAKKGEGYRKYFRSDWGRIDSEVRIISLSPHQTYKIDDTNASILWNGKPNYSHLNPEAAKRADLEDNRILTDYAFPDAGVYLIKATFCLIDELKACSIWIESKPIEVKVIEPTGEDLEIWNQIKGNRNIAILMQRGDFGTGDEAKKQRLTEQVEQIIERYPNSVYSQYLRQNLEKFKAAEERRRKLLEKIKRPQ